jgi:hypothetical protein
LEEPVDKLPPRVAKKPTEMSTKLQMKVWLGMGNFLFVNLEFLSF